MHSVIIQLGVEPLKKEEYVSEEEFFCDHWFTNEIADYVSDCSDEERLDALNILSNRSGIEVSEDEGGKYIVVTDKEKFFEQAYNSFQENLKKLSNLSLKGFSRYDSSVDWSIRKLNENYEDKQGIYIYQYRELCTIAEFVRFYDGGKYYIGGVLDYHL